MALEYNRNATGKHFSDAGPRKQRRRTPGREIARLSDRGAGDPIFNNTSSEATPEPLNNDFAEWAKHFAPSAVAFQIGYPSDEDGMDGDKNKGWWKLDDPIKDWGDELLAKVGDADQEIGLLWVCVKSGKTYNADWDLTKGARLPATTPKNR